MGRETLEFDVVIVGAGPAGLAAALHLARLGREHARQPSICVLEKGSEVGAHLLSGAILDPRALDELLPDWAQRGAPLETTVTEEKLRFLTATRTIPLPIPSALRNRGNFIISLGRLCRWLALEAEALGVEILPGFAATELLFDQDGAVKGVATGQLGVDRNRHPTATYQPGTELLARHTLLAEGCRGSLARQTMERYRLRAQCDPQTYALGFKELWEIPPQAHRLGLALHTIGWPLNRHTYGGGFLYHAAENQLAIGLIVGLDYANPYLDPFDEFQRFKSHPAIRPLLTSGRRLAYGARALSEGGLQSIPELDFPGGALIGDAAGFLDVPRLKGIHGAMKSGMLAAEAIGCRLHHAGEEKYGEYSGLLRESWVWSHLAKARNIRPGFQRGLWFGLANAAMELYLLHGRAPWTLHHRADHEQLDKAGDHARIDYPKADGVVTFDRNASLRLANISHRDNQPLHLLLGDATLPIRYNLALFDAPEQRYCPAGVYEILAGAGGEPRLQINAQNCIHCKACDIKDPCQNITWIPPEGGSGPNYGNM